MPPDPELSTDEVEEVLGYLMGRFSYAGVLYGRDDASLALGRPLTDEEWEMVRFHPDWNRLDDLVADASFALMANVVKQLVDA